MRPVYISDTTLRDAHQSLWATRMEIGDMLPILDKMDSVGYWSLEAWGGATFDTCIRFLDENPWERLRTIKRHCPKTPLQMLLRGQNLVGYKHYSDEIVHRFVHAAHRNGVDIFRVFDALNDIRNVEQSALAIKDSGAHFEGAISYTISPVHTIDSYIEYAQHLKELGADTIAIKDMAGMLTPYRTERMVKALIDEVGLPVHVHCHYIGGMAPMNYLKGIEAGASIVDTAVVSLAFGNSQPAVETIVAALKESEFDTGLDLDLLFEIAHYWEEVRERNNAPRGTTSLLLMEIFSHQVPGGMMSNLQSQLEIQNALDRLPDVLAEIPKVRAEVGYPPLCTPMSQIVGTQAVINVLTGQRWQIVPQEMKDYLRGLYGLSPAPINQQILDKVLGDEKPLDPSIRPGSLVTSTYAEFEAEIGDLARSEEDVLMYALFPNEARRFLTDHQQGAEGDVFLTGRTSSEPREDNEVKIGDIRELIKTLENSDVAEIVIEDGDQKLTLRKSGFGPAAPAVAPAAVQTHTAPAGAAVPAAPAVNQAGDRPASWKAITSPMVGTFYGASTPGAPPFVSVGDQVAVGDTLCIVEAMKLMNEIPATEAGVIREVAVSSGDLLEFGVPIFYYESI